MPIPNEQAGKDGPLLPNGIKVSSGGAKCYTHKAILSTILPHIWCGVGVWKCSCGSFWLLEDGLPWHWLKEHKRCVG